MIDHFTSNQTVAGSNPAGVATSEDTTIYAGDSQALLAPENINARVKGIWPEHIAISENVIVYDAVLCDHSPRTRCSTRTLLPSAGSGAGMRCTGPDGATRAPEPASIGFGRPVAEGDWPI